MSAPKKIKFIFIDSNSIEENNLKPNAPNNKTHSFLNFCSSYGFKGFSFSKIDTFIKNDVVKKKPLLPNWSTFDFSNYATAHYVSSGHTAFAIITGKTSNTTVIDVDDKDVYQNLVAHFPELKNTLTVETAKGFHVYCKYDKDIIGRTHAFKSYEKIDIRNDNELLFSPPTTYKNCRTGITEEYKIIYPSKSVPEFAHIPAMLKKDLKQFLDTNPSLSNPSLIFVTNNNDAALNEKRATIAKCNLTTEVLAEHVKLSPKSYDAKKEEITDLLNALHSSYCDSWENWFKIGAAIYNELGDSQESKDLFLHYSKAKSHLYADKVTMTDVENIWSSFKDDKKIKVTKASLYQQCKQTSLTLFKEIQKKHETFDFFQINSTTLAKHFVKCFGDDFIQNDSMGNLYYWDGNIWSSRIAKQRALQIIGNEFYTDLVKQWKNCCELKPKMNESDIKASDIIAKKLANLQRREFKMSVFQDILTELPLQAVDFDTNYDQINNLQFQNGILMLDKVKMNHIELLDVSNAFRKRTKYDYVSMALPYDYRIPKKDDINFVQNIFNQIQPESVQRDFQLSWLAYCLTGNTGAQIFKLGIGYSGSNEGNDKSHKQLIHLVSKPIRYAYIEELNRKKLDAELLKDVVDGHKLNVEVLYGTSVEKPIQAKISTFSNLDPKVTPDGGVIRRARLQQYLSEFIDNDKLEALGDKRKPNQFPLVQDLENQFLNTDMKLAYLWILLPYVANFYCHGLKVPEFAKQNFLSIAVEYDDISNALEDICTKGTDCDKIWKDDLVEQLGLRMNKTLTWNSVLPEIKRLGYKYERTFRAKSISGTSCKGAIVGLKWADFVLTNITPVLSKD